MLYDPAVIGEAFDVLETQVIPNPFDWVQLVMPDPKRVWLAFGGQATIGYVVTTSPDPLFANGYELPGTGLEKWEFVKAGPLCSVAWFIYGKGASNPVTVFWAAIRNPSPKLSMEF